MKKKIIITAIISLLIFLVYRYGFVLVFWLSTPGDGELRPEEIRLFNSIKSTSKAQDVWREPKYDIINPKDTCTYRIIIYKVKCNSKKDSLKPEALKIANEVNRKMNLDKNFVRYEIVYQCNDMQSQWFGFNRKELKY
ncbi:hypothetical protein AB4Y90_12005 [Chryseobacterium sp. 2TAF14]|uniref:hypothetical protein n=1 Tax=Chryseobacterium sp. 2TAF14 TaxID=3233007 RepID=UPI003F90EC08